MKQVVRISIGGKERARGQGVMRKNIKRARSAFLLWVAAMMASSPAAGHGTLVYPMSRVYRVYQSNPENPSFELARSAIAIDGTGPYYSWNEISQNIPEAVQAGLPPGFDYSPWVRDGELASGGRAGRDDSARSYLGLDQVDPQWPATPVTAGETIEVDFYATALAGDDPRASYDASSHMYSSLVLGTEGSKIAAINFLIMVELNCTEQSF